MPSVTAFSQEMIYVLRRPEKPSAWCPQIPGCRKRISTLKRVCVYLMKQWPDNGPAKREGHGLQRLSEAGLGKNSTRGAAQMLIDTNVLFYRYDSRFCSTHEVRFRKEYGGYHQ